MYTACLPQILVRDNVLASALCPRMLSYRYTVTGVGNHPHMSVLTTTPISNDSVARLGPMVQ